MVLFLMRRLNTVGQNYVKMCGEQGFIAVHETVHLVNFFFECLLPPQGFRPEAKSRGGTLVTRMYIKDGTYSSNIQSVC